jgi:hypothetical protein
MACPESLAAANPEPAAPPRGLTRAGLVRFGALAVIGAVGGGVALGGVLNCSNSTNPAVPYGLPPDCGPSTYACPDAESEAAEDAADVGSDVSPEATSDTDAGVDAPGDAPDAG